MIAIKKLLSAMTRRFGVDETIRAVPLIFEVQSLIKQTVIKGTARQRAAAALVVEWLLTIAEFYRIDSLHEYAEGIKQERLKHDEYSTVFMTNDLTVSEFEQLEPENRNIVDRFVDQAVVVEMLSKDGPLRDQDDVEGIDLVSKLNAQWDVNTEGNTYTVQNGTGDAD